MPLHRVVFMGTVCGVAAVQCTQFCHFLWVMQRILPLRLSYMYLQAKRGKVYTRISKTPPWYVCFEGGKGWEGAMSCACTGGAGDVCTGGVGACRVRRAGKVHGQPHSQNFGALLLRSQLVCERASGQRARLAATGLQFLQPLPCCHCCAATGLQASPRPFIECSHHNSCPNSHLPPTGMRLNTCLLNS